MSALMELTPEEKKKRRQRNLAIAGALIAFVALIYVITIVKLGGNVANRPF